MYAQSKSGEFRFVLDENDVKKMAKVLKPSTKAGGVRNFFYFDVKYSASDEDELATEATVMHLDDYEGKETYL